MLRQLAVTIVLAAAGVLGACATVPPVHSNVSAYVAPNFAPGLTHAVMSLDKDKEGDLVFQEYRVETERALGARGLTVVGDGAEPDVAVFLDYGIGAPRTTTSVMSLPTWGQTGVRSSTTTGQVSSTGSYSATTTYTPTYGVTGYQNIPYTTTTYTRHVVLTAYDYRHYLRTNEVRELWKVSVVSTGAKSDLRYIMPFMLASAAPYLGQSSGNTVLIKLDEKSPLRSFIATGQRPEAKKRK